MKRVRNLVHKVLEYLLDHKIQGLPSGSWLIVPRHNPPLLAVQASYNLGLPVAINYIFNSSADGNLTLRISQEGGATITELHRWISMPCEWLVDVNGRISVNGESIAESSSEINPMTWLVSELDFTTKAGERFSRRMRHRVLGDQINTGQEYYNGSNYSDYDQQKAQFGPEILDRLQKHAHIKSILDLGCATGIFVQHAMARGIEAAGVDVSPWAVERANQRVGSIACQTLDLDQAQQSDFLATYDAVVMHDVLEHVADPLRLIKLSASILNPGGLVYCHTLNADSLLHLVQGKDWAGYSDYTHRSTWLTARWLRDAFRTEGFELLEFAIPELLWTDNVCDSAMQELVALMAHTSARQLLRDGWGDTVEVVARKVDG